MGFRSDMSRDGSLPDGYEQATNFSQHMKRREEVSKKFADSRLSVNGLLPGFACYRNVVGVKRVEDLKISFVALANFCMGDGLVQGNFQMLHACVAVDGEAIG